MGLVEELGTFLDSESTRFTAGTNLFGNWLPSEPGTAASITETGGLPPVHTFGSDLPKYERQRVQLLCRSSNSTTARANINDAWVQLQEITNESLSSRSWLRVSAVQSPFSLGQDDLGRHLFACNFDCLRLTTAA